LQLRAPSLLDDLRVELGLEAAALRAVRTRLELLGAVVAKPIVLEPRLTASREPSVRVGAAHQTGVRSQNRTARAQRALTP